jgi:threonine/homoserine/homoserine lactone efflux protein
VHFILKGAVLGFLIAAPVGPIGLLCITRTLRDGWLTGFCSGLGAATADAAYASVAAFGIKAVIVTLAAVFIPLHVGGACLLCWLAARTIWSHAPIKATTECALSATAAFASTVLLTILNPATIVAFVAVFAVSLGSRVPSWTDAFSLVAGVFAGSASWWFLLSGSVALSRRRLGAQLADKIAVLSGSLLIAFGCASLFVRWR